MDEGKVALVTGAARRIGAQIARELHARGWRVVIHAHRSTAEAESVAAELERARPNSTLVRAADLADPAAIGVLAAVAHARWGRLDALVNNASTYQATPLGAIDVAQVDDLLATNLKAPLLLSQACAPRMEQGGAIVNIIDVNARRPLPRYSAYAAAKAGLWAITESLAQELAPRLRVNGVAPGHMLWAENEPLDAQEQARVIAQVPLGRLGGAIEIARAVAFLLSDDAAYITGAVLPVDGGLRL